MLNKSHRLLAWKEKVDQVEDAAGPGAPDLHADADPVPVKVVQEEVVVEAGFLVIVVGVGVHDHGLRLEPLGHLKSLAIAVN